MRCVKKYEEGGGLYEIDAKTERRLERAARIAEREERQRDRRYQRSMDEGTPSNPRFLMGAPNVTSEDYGNDPNLMDRIMLMLTGGESKPKVKNRGRARGGMTTGGRRRLFNPVPPGC